MKATSPAPEAASVQLTYGRANIPVNAARAMGADIVIAVNVNERFAILPPESFKPVGSVTKRIVALQLASDAAVRLKAAAAWK